MKKTLLFLFVLAGITTFAQSGPQATFEKKTLLFENVKEGTQLKVVYYFTNTGTENLKITKVKPTCGCTVAKFPRYDIKPGQQDSIVATFDSNHRPGRNAKGVNLESNAGEINLIFEANVIPKKVTPADHFKEDSEIKLDTKIDHSGHNHR